MNKNKKTIPTYSFEPWPYNPLVTLIRRHSTELISTTITHYKIKNRFAASHFDLIIQVMLIACSYDPTDIWLGNMQDILVTSELVAKGAAHEAAEVLEDAIDKKQVWLNKKLIKAIALHEIAKLHKLQPTHHETVIALKKQLIKLKVFKPNATLSSLRLFESNSQMSVAKAIAIEKISQKKVVFRRINRTLSKDYAKKFHYLHAVRHDDMLAFGVFLEGEKYPFAWVSYAPIGRTYKHRILEKSGIDPQQSLELTRAWNHELAPKNTMSMLFAYAHAQIQRFWLRRYQAQLFAILTDVNPNLGFKGSAFRAVGFGLIGQKPTAYHYLTDAFEKRHYFTRRKLHAYLQRKKNSSANYLTSVFPLLPTNELAVILEGTKRLRPEDNIYKVTKAEYRQEETAIYQ